MRNEEEYSKISKFLSSYNSISSLQEMCEELQQDFNAKQSQKIDTEKIEDESYMISISKLKVFIVTAILFSFISPVLSTTQFKNIPGFFEMIFTIFSFVVIFGLPWLVEFLRVKKKKNAARNLYNQKVENAVKINNTIDNICSSINEEYQAKLTQINSITKQLKNDKNSIVPQQYWAVANDIYNLMSSGRADTLKEAINLLEDIWHKNRLENIASQNAPDDNWYERQLMKEQLEATKNVEKHLDRMDWGLY